MKAIQKIMIPVQQISSNSWYIHFNIETKVDVDGNSYQEADEVIVTDPTNRNEVITAIIRSKYTQDAVEAIINNYLSDDDDTNEYADLQRWRKAAKAIASGTIRTKTEIDSYILNEEVNGISEIVASIVEVLNDKNLLTE